MTTLVTAQGPNGAVGAVSIRLPTSIKYPLGAFIFAGNDFSGARCRLLGLNDDDHAIAWQGSPVFNGSYVSIDGNANYGVTKVMEKKNGFIAGILRVTDTMADTPHCPVIGGNFKSTLATPNGVSLNIGNNQGVSLRLCTDSGGGAFVSAQHSLNGLTGLTGWHAYIGTWRDGIDYCISVPSQAKTTGDIANTQARGVRTDLPILAGSNDVTLCGNGDLGFWIAGGDDDDTAGGLNAQARTDLYGVMKTIADFNLGIDVSGWA